MESPRTLRQLLVYVSFYGVFLAIGTFVTWFTLWSFLCQQWRMNNVFVETDGTIIDKRRVLMDPTFIQQVQVRYRADDREFESWNYAGGSWGSREITDFNAIQVGEQRRVWFDPAKPDRVIVERGYWGTGFLFYSMLLVGLVCAGGAGHTIVRGLRAWLSA
jgi:hypothetical protein